METLTVGYHTASHYISLAAAAIQGRREAKTLRHVEDTKKQKSSKQRFSAVALVERMYVLYCYFL